MRIFVPLVRRTKLLALVCTGVVIVSQLGASVAAFADEASYAATAEQALIILKSTDINDMHKTIATLKDAGIHPMHVIPPRVVIADVPAGVEQSALAISNVASVHRSAVTPIAADKGADLVTGTAAWNYLVSPELAAPLKIPPEARPLIGDAFEPPMPPVSQSLGGSEAPQAAPGTTSTSEFMIGSVAVGVILPESNEMSENTENWSTARQNTVFSEIVAGLNWWATKGGIAANLTFYYDQKFSVPTQYEPITRSGYSEADQNIWVTDIFQNMGYTSGNRFARARAYINYLRTTYNTDWCYTFIVVDSLTDTDGMFTSGYFAWAYLGGPYVIMTYDNDGWDIGNMNSVASHETGHIFLAADEYCDPGYACCDFDYYGYLNIYNGNCEDGNPSSVPCVMRDNENVICTYTNGQIGWRDTDGNGKPDPIDNVVANTLNSHTTPTAETILTFTGTATDVPYDSPTRTDVTINKISAVKYRIDSGTWTDASASDGSFNEDSEGYTFTTPPLGTGQHRIDTQAYSTSGNTSTVVGQDVEIILQPPIAEDVNVSTSLDTLVTITLQATDDGLPNPPGVLSYIITSLPTNGSLSDPSAGGITAVPYTLSGNGNQVIYMPTTGYSGLDSFQFKANDNNGAEGGDSNIAAVSISVIYAIYMANMDTNPGWSATEQWQWGVPTGQGGTSHGNHDPTGGYTGSKVYGVNLNGDYSTAVGGPYYLITQAINCSGFENIHLKFYRWLNSDYQPYVSATVEVSNNASTWTTKWENGGSPAITDSSWQLLDYDISSVADGQPNVYVRWGYKVASGAYAYSGWNIDDVNITGVSLNFIISGYIKNECDVPIAGVLVEANNGGGEGTTDVNGFYEVWVDYNWSGTVTPTKGHHTFNPGEMVYVDVLADQTEQNYQATNIYDLDCDGSIGFGDLRIISENWLDGPDLPGDFYKDEDDIVNFLDFAEFAKHWLEGPIP